VSLKSRLAGTASIIFCMALTLAPGQTAMFRGDARHTGVYGTTAEPVDGVDFKLEWSLQDRRKNTLDACLRGWRHLCRQ